MHFVAEVLLLLPLLPRNGYQEQHSNCKNSVHNT
jgi:hypothetical protein